MSHGDTQKLEISHNISDGEEVLAEHFLSGSLSGIFSSMLGDSSMNAAN